MTASRLAYLTTFHASLLTALLVEWLAPELGGRLMTLGLCAALLVCHVDLVERRTAVGDEERDRTPGADRSRLRSLGALRAARPTVFALSAVLGMVARGSPSLVITIAALTLVGGVVSERADRSRHPRRPVGTLSETWRARGPARGFDVAYLSFFVTIAALSLGLPEDAAVVGPVAVSAVVVLALLAYGQGVAERRHAEIASPDSPSGHVGME